ncbi:MAG: TadE/TadG family type IV pilus assembly protein [Bdellovibrionota bacterium]
MVRNLPTHVVCAGHTIARRGAASKLLSSALGATMMEVALVIPILFVLIFGFIDIARYWQAKAAVSQAAAEGANKLVVDPNLKKKGSSVPADQQQYDQTLATTKSYVENRAKNLMLQGNVAVNADISIPSTVDEFKRVPVEVTTSATFNPILPIIWHDAIQISTKVSAYVEPLKTSAEPIPTDCYGRLFDSTTPPGAPPYNQGCPCEKGALSYSNSAGQCVCSGATTQNGTSEQPDKSCGCPDGTIAILAYDWSFMAGPWTPEAIQAANAASTICCPPDTPKSCPGNQVRPSNPGAGQYSCQCSCGTGATAGSDGNCVCTNPNTQYTPNVQVGSASCVCQLKASDCPSPSTLNSTMCQCTCAAPKVYDVATKTCVCDSAAAATCTSSGGTVNSSTCACGCPANKQLSGSSCVCKSADVSACQASGGSMDPTTCQCGGCGQGVSQGTTCACPNGGTLVNGNCNCGSSKDWNVGQGMCACKADITNDCQAAGGTINATNCSCSCPGNRVWNASTKTCDCDPTLKFYCDTNLYNPWGYPSGTYDNNSCACNCPAHSSLISNLICYCSGGSASGNSCVCPSGQMWQGNSCVCDTSTAAAVGCTAAGSDGTWSQSGSTCSCTCPGGKVFNGTSCACPSGKVWNGSSCVCDTSTAAAQTCINSGGSLNASCTCGSCSGGKVLVNGACQCASGQIWNGSACVCDSSTAAATTCTSAPSNGSWVQSGSSCSCSCAGGKVVTSGSCQCPTGKIWNGSSCVCDTTTAAAQLCTTTGGQLNSSCACTNCPGGKVLQGGQCVCPSGQAWNGNACVCDATTANATKCTNSPSNGTWVQGGATCSCSCSGGKVLVNGACTCPTAQMWDGSKCVCDPNLTAALNCTNSGGTLNAACSCGSCPTNMQLSNGSCICNSTLQSSCTNSNGQYNAGNCSCTCPTGSSLQGNGTCSACSGGQIVVNGACTCPPGKTMQNGTCQCDTATATACTSAGGNLDPSSCACNCPSGATMSGNQCTCQGFMQLTASGCVCPAYYQGYTATQTSPTTCALSCTGSRHEWNGWCIKDTCKENCPGGYSNDGGCPSCPNNG